MDLFFHVHHPGVTFSLCAAGMTGEHLGGAKITMAGVKVSYRRMPQRVNSATRHAKAQGDQEILPALLDDAFGHVAAVADLLRGALRALDEAGFRLAGEEPAIRIHLAPVDQDVRERRRHVDHLRLKNFLLPADDPELAVNDVIRAQMQDLAGAERGVRSDDQEDIEAWIRLQGPS